MLALSRRVGERVYTNILGVWVFVEVVEVDRGKVKLAFSTPPEARHVREEILSATDRREAEART